MSEKILELDDILQTNKQKKFKAQTISQLVIECLKIKIKQKNEGQKQLLILVQPFPTVLERKWCIYFIILLRITKYRAPISIATQQSRKQL